MLNQQNNFRKDINGLRAWAVVAVILFHFNVPGFSGGFVGVDIFFVISGYLMTGIIARGLQSNNFSIINFYISRARRILPALIVLCLALLVVAWFFLSPVDLVTHTKHTKNVLQFTSNYRFLHEAGYFNAASHEKLLLHTWSLSVEWQFYLLLPLLLALIWKLKPNLKALKIAVLAAFFISFFLSVIISTSSPSQAFYSLHTRAWEMLAGGLVYLFLNQLLLTSIKQRLLEALGFILVISSIVFFDEESIWPGWLALAPVLGSVLILTAVKQNSFLTNAKIIQHLGNWSYSLYLWHWPLAALLIQFDLRGDMQTTLIFLILTILLGWISFRYIEIPTRKKLVNKNKWLNFTAFAVAIIVVLIANTEIKKYKNHPERIPEEVAAIFNEADNKDQILKICTSTNCMDSVGFILLGDSHAMMLRSMTSNALPTNKYLLDWGKSGCVTIEGIQRRKRKNYKECTDFIDDKLKENQLIDKNIPLLIANRASLYVLGDVKQRKDAKHNQPKYYIKNPYLEFSEEYFEELSEGIVNTACKFAQVRQVYMMRPVPEFSEHVPNTMGKSLWHTGKIKEVKISREDYYKRHSFVWNAQDKAEKECGIKIIDSTAYLCNESYCKGGINGTPIYADSNHLNQYGAKLLEPAIKNILKQNNE